MKAYIFINTLLRSLNIEVKSRRPSLIDFNKQINAFQSYVEISICRNYVVIRVGI